MDNRQHVPTDCVCGKQVAEKAGDVAKTVRVVAVDGLVIFSERGLEEVSPEAI